MVLAVLEMKITNSDVVEFSGEPLGLRDATLVDGPSILQYYPAISGYDGLGFGGVVSRCYSVSQSIWQISLKVP